MKKIKHNLNPVRDGAYTYFGVHDFLDWDDYPQLFDVDGTKSCDREECFAMSRNERYFVKANSRGQLYDPEGLNSQNTHKTHRHGTGRKMWEYKEVNYNCFLSYINFLRSKKRVFLSNAERESQ